MISLLGKPNQRPQFFPGFGRKAGTVEKQDTGRFGIAGF
jgi:hypothetical protein